MPPPSSSCAPWAASGMEYGMLSINPCGGALSLPEHAATPTVIARRQGMHAILYIAIAYSSARSSSQASGRLAQW